MMSSIAPAPDGLKNIVEPLSGKKMEAAEEEKLKLPCEKKKQVPSLRPGREGK